MADNTSVAIDLNVNTGGADEAVNDVGNAIDGLKAKTEQAAVSGKEAYSQFRNETRGLTGDTLSLAKGTAEYNAALMKLATHKAEFAELREQIKTLDPRQQTQAFAEFGMTGVRAMGGIGAAAAVATGNSGEMAEEMMRVMGIMQIMDGLVAVGDIKKQAGAIKTAIVQKLVAAGYVEETAAISGATIAQGILNAVTDAWPIAALIVGIIAIASAVALWNNSAEDLAASQQKVIDSIQTEQEEADKAHTIIHDQIQNEIDLLTAEKAGYDKIAKAKEEQRKADAAAALEQIGQQELLIKAQMAKNDAEESEISIWENLKGIVEMKSAMEIAADHATNDASKERNKTLQEEQDKLETLVNSYNKLAIEEKKDNTAHEKEVATKSLAAKKETIEAELLLVQKGSEQELALKKKAAQLEYEDEIRQDDITAEKKKAATLKYQNELLKLQDDFDTTASIGRAKAWQKDDTDKEKRAEYDRQHELLEMQISSTDKIAVAKKQFELEFAQAQGDDNKILQAEIKFQKELDDITKASDEKRTADMKKEQEKRQKLREDESKSATDITDGLVSLGELLSKKGKENSDAQKAIALVQLAVKEAIAIANVVAVATDPANPANLATGGLAAIPNIAAGIAGVLAAMVQAKSILSGGNSSSTAAISGAGQSAPTLGGGTLYGGAPKTNASGVTDYAYSGMGKVYVAQTDLSQANQIATLQNLNRRKH